MFLNQLIGTSEQIMFSIAPFVKGTTINKKVPLLINGSEVLNKHFEVA